MNEETWWPSLEEYNPNISKQKWTELLKDEKPVEAKTVKSEDSDKEKTPSTIKIVPLCQGRYL